MTKTFTIKDGQAPTQEQLEEVRAAAKREIQFDEDSPELSPAMFKAFRCTVTQRNRKKEERISVSKIQQGMIFMFGFGKKKIKADNAPEKRLAEFQRKKDWAGVSRTYYELGVAAMDAGNLHEAQLWLHRADTIYSADDNIYDKVGEKLMDDCSDRIGRLEDKDGLFYNDIPTEIEPGRRN